MENSELRKMVQEFFEEASHTHPSNKITTAFEDDYELLMANGAWSEANDLMNEWNCWEV